MSSLSRSSTSDSFLIRSIDSSWLLSPLYPKQSVTTCILIFFLMLHGIKHTGQHAGSRSNAAEVGIRDALVHELIHKRSRSIKGRVKPLLTAASVSRSA